MKWKKKTEIPRKNLELENLYIETLENKKIFDVNISFEKEKKQERENSIIDKIKEKVRLNNDDIYVKYYSEDNSYDEKEYIIKGLYALNKKLKKTKGKQIKRDLKQIKKECIELLEKKYREIELARHLKH